ncbi:MAG: hypothetical protein AAGH15_03460 [Myxococcota bacterium]
MPRSLGAAALLLGLLGACGGPGYDGRVYRDDEARYALEAPGDAWEALDVDAQNDLAWRHRGIGAVMQANARCDPALDIPLEALTAHLLIGFTERRDREETRVPMDGREALRTELRAKLDGVERSLVFVVLKKDGCVYDFALVAAPAHRDEAGAAFDALVASFAAGRGGQ